MPERKKPGPKPATNGRRKGKESLADTFDVIAEMRTAAIASELEINEELLRAYAGRSRPNLPPATVLTEIADYLDRRMARLRKLTEDLRKHARHAPTD